MAPIFASSGRLPPTHNTRKAPELGAGFMRAENLAEKMVDLRRKNSNRSGHVSPLSPNDFENVFQALENWNLHLRNTSLARPSP